MATGTTLGLIRIVSLILGINNNTFIHNVIISEKLKQPLIVRLDFAQRYKLA